MNSMLRRRYSLYAASSSGADGVLKSSDGVKNVTAAPSSVTRSCSRKIHIPAEVFKQREEVFVPRQCLAETRIHPGLGHDARQNFAVLSPNRMAKSNVGINRSKESAFGQNATVAG